MANTSACVRRQGESPGNQIMLLNSVLAELAAQGSMRASARIRSRALPRGRNTVWVVFADSEKDLRWLGSRGCPVRLAPSGPRALKAVTDRVRSRSGVDFSPRAVTRSEEHTSELQS